MKELILILTLVTVSFVRTCPPGCEDTGDMCEPPLPPPPKLNDDQMQMIQNQTERIMMLQQNPDLLRDPTNQEPIVTFTTDQMQDALDNYPSYFRSEANLPPLPSNKRKRRQTGVRVCEPIMSWDAITIAVNADDEVVQVVQFESEDSQQWFLTETCEYDYSPLTENTCTETTRYVTAYVIDLSSGDFSTKEDWIQIDCCATYT